LAVARLHASSLRTCTDIPITAELATDQFPGRSNTPSLHPAPGAGQGGAPPSDSPRYAPPDAVAPDLGSYPQALRGIVLQV
jgi:hypothetical protein